jgi:hypothetical protein
MTLSSALDIEHREELRVCPIVWALACGRQSRNFHTKDVVEERERTVHVFDKRGEYPSPEDGWRIYRRLTHGRTAKPDKEHNQQSHI